MKQLVLEIEDSVYEQFMGMVNLCQGVTMVSTSNGVETMDIVDYCFLEAIKELRDNHVIKHRSDLAYIMLGANDGVIKGLVYFYSPNDYSGYLLQLGIEDLPPRSTIYNKVNDTIGKFPDWEFVGDVKPKEILRRKNIVNQFISAYGRIKRQKLDGFLDK